MAMSTKVQGIVPPDDKWHNMKKIWDSCEAENIAIPDEVLDYFKEEDPNPEGIVVDIASTKSGRDMEDWHEVTVADIPDNVKIIRFINSW